MDPYKLEIKMLNLQDCDIASFTNSSRVSGGDSFTISCKALGNSLVKSSTHTGWYKGKVLHWGKTWCLSAPLLFSFHVMPGTSLHLIYPFTDY